MTDEWFEQPRTRRIVLCLIVGLFAITNLPWTLDDYDQAKQAYTSLRDGRAGALALPAHA
mgnify:CR=1 FL=1